MFVRQVNSTGVEGVIIYACEKCFRMKRVATVKVAHFTLRYSAKLATANAVRALLLRKYSAKGL
ncbi:hypothetical protein C1E24_20880 [Pseudoalteromonas phenolica]|uniref:Uncharacterized protein n=1 Tax=Pseudoalteromonas phenolica TaxID=161398 RepID=A0A5R9PVY3_9GAMM|nr:hypothetical protein C1E24_20880 [Pseudoalteromonas phenolica]